MKGEREKEQGLRGAGSKRKMGKTMVFGSKSGSASKLASVNERNDRTN